jgi:acyl carrier protein
VEDMEKDAIVDTVFRVLKKISGYDQPMELDMTLANLRINSLKIIQLISTLENELDFELLPEDMVIANFATPRSTITLMRKYCAEKVA